MPQPSPRTKPSAAASNVLQRPSGAIIPHWLKHTKASGSRSTFTPPASARSLSPVRRLWHAWCTATSDDEQAVSTAMHGPCRPERVRDAPGGGVERAAGRGVDVELGRRRRPWPAARSRCVVMPTNTPVALPPASPGRCRPARAPPSSPRAAGAAAGPSWPPRAARCRRTAGRTGRSGRGTPPCQRRVGRARRGRSPPPRPARAARRVLADDVAAVAAAAPRTPRASRRRRGTGSRCRRWRSARGPAASTASSLACMSSSACRALWRSARRSGELVRVRHREGLHVIEHPRRLQLGQARRAGARPGRLRRGRRSTGAGGSGTRQRGAGGRRRSGSAPAAGTTVVDEEAGEGVDRRVVERERRRQVRADGGLDAPFSSTDISESMPISNRPWSSRHVGGRLDAERPGDLVAQEVDDDVPAPGRGRCRRAGRAGQDGRRSPPGSASASPGADQREERPGAPGLVDTLRRSQSTDASVTSTCSASPTSSRRARRGPRPTASGCRPELAHDLLVLGRGDPHLVPTCPSRRSAPAAPRRAGGGRTRRGTDWRRRSARARASPTAPSSRRRARRSRAAGRG